MTQFVSLSSGSNGNCYYIGNETCGILIDAGIGTRTIKKRMTELGLPIDRVRCVLVSHDHFDHIRSLGTFAERFQKPVYATAPCIRAFDRHYCTRGYLGAGNCRELIPGVAQEIEDGITVLPFRVPHDATDTVGFFIGFLGETFTFLTDLGDVTDEAVHYASRSRHLIVEANYDLEMLIHGTYPPELKERIRNGHGHLSNDQTAELVSRALTSGGVNGDSDSDSDSDGITDVFLCHLSENNNTPELALAAVSAILPSNIRLSALPRREPSTLFTWE